MWFINLCLQYYVRLLISSKIINVLKQSMICLLIKYNDKNVIRLITDDYLCLFHNLIFDNMTDSTYQRNNPKLNW